MMQIRQPLPVTHIIQQTKITYLIRLIFHINKSADVLCWNWWQKKIMRIQPAVSLIRAYFRNAGDVCSMTRKGQFLVNLGQLKDGANKM